MAAPKLAVDELLAAGRGLADLEALRVPFADWSRAAQPRQPTVELLDGAPATLTRPLALVDGVAYAVTWVWVQRTVTESVVDDRLVRHDPPLVEARREMLAVCGDGSLFGPAGDSPLAELGLAIKLAEPVRAGKEWRALAVKAYRAGRRPDPPDVFARLVSIYDYFVDFSRSFTDQAAMCELCACFSLATWLLPAFSVVGYPWFSGERGSGKTKCGTCWALTSYLGEVLLSSGSFAALRDLADYGAALLFDDAEALADPERSDPAKRELVLAGTAAGPPWRSRSPAPTGPG